MKPKPILRTLLLASRYSLVATSAAFALCANATPVWAFKDAQQKQANLAQWTHDRLGMFIHWGIYAVPGRHEWIKLREKISDTDYQKYFTHFDPDLYNPQEWAARAKAAGMKYVVITAKHHDGFCLWDSKHTEYKSTNTPAKRDLLKSFVEAFRAEGIRVGFYYSLIDWHHPHFTIDRNYPPVFADIEARKAANAGRDMAKYRQYMKDQLTELLTQYGRIDELFLDFSYAHPRQPRPGERLQDYPDDDPTRFGKNHKDWDSENLLKLVRELQPGILVNNRLDLDHTDWGWDFVTPEQYMPNKWPTVRGKRVPWETCQTFSGSWGYHRDEHSWKSVRQLVVMLIETVSKGGNLLLNVGPTARGTFDARAIERLEGIGKWMDLHNRSIYGCTEAPAEFARPPNTLLTHNPATNRLYVHVLEWPFKTLRLPGYAGKVKSAQLLNDASEIRIHPTRRNAIHTSMTEPAAETDLLLDLPVSPPNTTVPVIELFLK